jgi:Arc/MetJ-type ribon-helix-helix transcriptional regulator
MPISLSPDLDDGIQQKVIQVGYRTPDEVIRKALDALEAQERHEGIDNLFGTSHV